MLYHNVKDNEQYFPVNYTVKDSFLFKKKMHKSAFSLNQTYRGRKLEMKEKNRNHPSAVI